MLKLPNLQNCMVTRIKSPPKPTNSPILHRQDYATSEFLMPLRSFARFDLSVVTLDFTNSDASSSLRHTAQLGVMMSLLGALRCLGNQWGGVEPKIGVGTPNHPLKYGFSIFKKEPSILGCFPYCWKHPNDAGKFEESVHLYESMYISFFLGRHDCKGFVLIFISTGEMIRVDKYYRLLYKAKFGPCFLFWEDVEKQTS